MQNFSKQGYSVREVAQMLHTTPTTIRNMISDGRLKALMSSDKVERGHRRVFRITKEQIADHIEKFPYKYDACLVSQFTKSDPCEKPEEPKATAIPTGAWAKLLEDNHQEEIVLVDPVTSITESVVPVRKEKKPAKADVPYNLLVNGRIAVGNITLSTAKALLSTIMDDPFCDVKSIEIVTL